MKVVISAGGTGGHIYPALAIINKIKEIEPDSEFLYIGTHNRMEKDIVPTYDVPFKAIEIYGFNRKNMLKNIKTLKCLIGSYKKCEKMIKKFNPDVVLGFGGYVTFPVIKTAKKLGYKTFIHEQNSVPGKANSYLEKYADLIGVSFKSSSKFFPTYKTVFTGNPCSEEALKVLPASKREFHLDEKNKLVLIVMGSLGSAKINDFLKKSVNLFKDKDYDVLFVTGKNNYEEIANIKIPKNVHIVPYVDKLTRVMKKCDLIVTRGGASTLSEIMALKLPSIIIPSPYVPNNHQYKNALDLANVNASVILEEENLKGDILVRTIDELINNPDKLEEMSNNLEGLGPNNSATIIYENIKELIDRK